jgi:hypothetical protein
VKERLLVALGWLKEQPSMVKLMLGEWAIDRLVNSGL